MVILIELPKHFPNEPPQLKFVNAVINHPWVDDSGRIIGANTIYSWSSTSLVLEVVKESLNHFIQFPPKVVKMIPRNSKESNQTRSEISPEAHNSLNNIQTPEDFPELSELSEKEMNALLEDSTKFNTFFNSLEFVQNFKQNQEDEKASLTEVSEMLKEKQEDIDILLKSNNLLKTEVKELHQEREKLITDISELEKSVSKESIIEKLKLKINKLNAKSTKLFETYSDQKLNSDKFLDDYLLLRTDYYLAKSQEVVLKSARPS